MSREATLARGGRAREPIADDTLEKARQSALRLLERTRRTRSELERRLRDKGHTPALIEEVLARLGAVGLIDDVEYARAFLNERWGRRSAGWRRLQAELRKRGISPEDIETARARFEEERGAADEVTAARRAIAQAARRYASLDPRVRRQRLYAMLMRRGFDGDVIEQALRGGGAETPD
jgi:regulatory protein